ncbi:MAG: molybdenum cofactor guanylyltransferase, partial [Candidatus Hodarchaeota archaeon]
MESGDLTVAILVGGESSRFKSEKALVEFNGKPLLEHMIGIAKRLSDRVLVAVSDEQQKENLANVLKGVEVATDPDDTPKSALRGAVTAFEYSDREYTLLLPVDTPLVNRNVMTRLYELRQGHGAVVPTWPSGYVEPLHSVYLTEHAYAQGLKTVEARNLRMKNLLDSLTSVLYISTIVLKEFDPDLNSFVNINTLKDLKELEK